MPRCSRSTLRTTTCSPLWESVRATHILPKRTFTYHAPSIDHPLSSIVAWHPLDNLTASF